MSISFCYMYWIPSRIDTTLIKILTHVYIHINITSTLIENTLEIENHYFCNFLLFFINVVSILLGIQYI